MSTFFLIRHADNDMVGKTLAGRKPGVHLNKAGQDQAARLAQKLAGAGLTHILSSPLERAIETAQPLATRLGLEIEIKPAFNELDFGDWTGQSFVQLAEEQSWKQWNASRSTSRAPHGEMMLEAQQRFVFELEKLSRELPSGRLAVFSHADALRAVLMYYLGMPLDFYARLDLRPASFSVLSLKGWGAQIHTVGAEVTE